MSRRVPAVASSKWGWWKTSFHSFSKVYNPSDAIRPVVLYGNSALIQSGLIGNDFLSSPRPTQANTHAGPITLFADKTVHIQPSFSYTWPTACFVFYLDWNVKGKCWIFFKKKAIGGMSGGLFETLACRWRLGSCRLVKFETRNLFLPLVYAHSPYNIRGKYISRWKRSCSFASQLIESPDKNWKSAIVPPCVRFSCSFEALLRHVVQPLYTAHIESRRNQIDDKSGRHQKRRTKRNATLETKKPKKCLVM